MFTVFWKHILLELDAHAGIWDRALCRVVSYDNSLDLLLFWVTLAKFSFGDSLQAGLLDKSMLKSPFAPMGYIVMQLPGTHKAQQIFLSLPLQTLI